MTILSLLSLMGLIRPAFHAGGWDGCPVHAGVRDDGGGEVLSLVGLKLLGGSLGASDLDRGEDHTC